MFTCPSCLNKTPSLKVSGDGLKCPACFTPADRAAVLHIKAGLKGKAKGVTVATKRHIWQRGLGNDGKTVINKSTGKRWGW